MNYFQQESSRLLYRKLTEDDIENWIPFFEQKDYLGFLGIDVKKDSKTLATEWIFRQFERYKNEGLGHLAVVEKASGNFIGVGGILPRLLNDKAEFEIAYSLKPEFWKKGYGTEIAQKMKLFGVENNITNSFISIIHKDNLASINVAKKNKMFVLYETIYMEMPVFVFGDIVLNVKM